MKEQPFSNSICFHLSAGYPHWCEAEVTLVITPLSPEISFSFLDPRAKNLYVYLSDFLQEAIPPRSKVP